MDNDFNRQEYNRSIDVTKPRNTPTPYANLDASRVSDYTLKEQAALERLAKRVSGGGGGGGSRKEDRAGIIKTIIAIVLVIILIVLAIAFISVLKKNNKETQEADYDMRLSMQIENKSTLSIITEAGKEQLREINPGERVSLRATVRNSINIVGDRTEENALPPPIYVRFRLVLILDYQERYDIMIPEMTNRWYKYDKEAEDGLMGGVASDDHYYYYLGSLAYMQPEVLFTAIKFNGETITCDDGGKYGQIQVHVESIEADIDNLVNRSMWPTAPQEWIVKMVSNQTSGNTGSNFNS